MYFGRQAVQTDEHIRQNIDTVIRELQAASERGNALQVYMGAVADKVARHEANSLTAHGIKQLILDVINENLIENAGFEADEDADGIPDNWSLVTSPSIQGTVAIDATVYKLLQPPSYLY